MDIIAANTTNPPTDIYFSFYSSTSKSLFPLEAFSDQLLGHVKRTPAQDYFRLVNSDSGAHFTNDFSIKIRL